MFHELAGNQFATGLLMTTLLAALLAYLRNVPQKLLRWFWAQFAVCAEFKNTDPAFNWIAMWLDQQPYSKRTRQLAVYTYHVDEDEYDSGDGPSFAQRKRNRPKVLFTPAQGEHIFLYKGRLVWLSRSKAEAGQQNNGTASLFERESFTLWVIGRGQDLIREIVQDAMDLALPEGAPETRVIPSADGRWHSAIRRKPRTRKSVILDGGALDGIIGDAQQFLKNKGWYEDLGIPYRRGYLLHGVPGSGKTSAVLAVAGDLGLDVYMLNLGDRYLDDGRLNYLLAQVPPGNIVLLEDIDAAFKERELSATRPTDVTDRPLPKKREVESGSITFSGLLNALDGVAAREGRLLFMTTNHKDALDPALIRPGRADMHVEFSYATHAQATMMFRRFFPDADPDLAVRFGGVTPNNCIAMASIQDHLLTHKSCPDTALATWQRECDNKRSV